MTPQVKTILQKYYSTPDNNGNCTKKKYDNKQRSDEPKNSCNCFHTMATTSPDNILLLGSENTSNHFHGYCLDSGESRTVVGDKQFHTYKTNVNKIITTTPIPHPFRSGNRNHQNTGSFIARIPFPMDRF